jgi:hypothetical protein
MKQSDKTDRPPSFTKFIAVLCLNVYECLSSGLSIEYVQVFRPNDDASQDTASAQLSEDSFHSSDEEILAGREHRVESVWERTLRMRRLARMQYLVGEINTLPRPRAFGTTYQMAGKRRVPVAKAISPAVDRLLKATSTHRLQTSRSEPSLSLPDVLEPPPIYSKDTLERKASDLKQWDSTHSLMRKMLHKRPPTGLASLSELLADYPADSEPVVQLPHQQNYLRKVDLATLSLVDSNGTETRAELEGAVVGWLFAAQWCSPCRTFVAVRSLARFCAGRGCVCLLQVL